MAYENILYEVEAPIAIITINRPKVMNALSPEVMAELGQAFEEAKNDDSVGAVILTGAGDKAFVAGADISKMANLTPIQARYFARSGQEVLFNMERLPKPIIAAVNGFALGGGCEIAMACDFIYAADNAKFGQPEINLGVIPGFGGTQRLTRLVGKGWAKELCMTGQIISAAEAQRIGIVNKLFPLNTLLDEAKKTAKTMASKGKASLRAAKCVIDDGFDMPLDKALFVEADAFALCFASPDQKEGMGAFLEKRKAEFKGKLND